ncbi:uncharacterized protein A1O5_10519 [Cladophialophora psammophila CBS 110553]|uniref:Prion-inhibition and propagation HeLo domain-containing protein n=1 Tax=Cladophialophora psammophila CBS 110553 TaxID=1182543 RepID=W9WE56_9EURO|nr:uncharacterized protein A1O5_10519 [Cladophialophora psammophila CBS 110553]EXJ66367.1 hypothetical protein A1O5_10519 [Cladophialophora psammophila CBS 110553]
MAEFASSIAGFVSLSVQLFDGCVKGFILLSAAQGFGRRAEIFGCQLEWQHYHLHRWATLAGLFKEPPELNTPNLVLIEKTLRTLEQVLTDADTLQNDYGLKIEITADEIQELHNSKRLFRGIKIFSNNATKEFLNDTARVYQRRTSPWKKFKWAIFDQTKFETLIRDVQFFNEQLRSTLHWTEQGQYTGNSCDTLRSLINLTNDKDLLEIITNKLDALDSAIQASARLKQRSLLLEILDDGPNGQGWLTPSRTHRPTSSLSPSGPSMIPRQASPGRDLRRDFKFLRRSSSIADQTLYHEVASYNDQKVVLEWKTLPQHTERRLKHRIAAVADLLSGLNSPTFHSLKCIGYLKEPKTLRYAYIFQPPKDDEFSLRTLQDLVAGDVLRPSINQRLVIASALTETVLQLHTAGWLHKSIRSDNVLFFQSRKADWSSLENIPEAYLGGYEFARWDNMLETTEAPGAFEHSRLYRHPLSLSEDRIPFCKAFDLYSLGCVLLEIGLWRPLLTMILDWTRKHLDSTSNSSHYRLPRRSTNLNPTGIAEWESIFSEKENFLYSAQSGRVAEELRFCMGRAYTGVVEKCLNAAAAASYVSVPPADEGCDENDSNLDISLDLQQECLLTLRSLIDHI